MEYVIAGLLVVLIILLLILLMKNGQKLDENIVSNELNKTIESHMNRSAILLLEKMNKASEAQSEKLMNFERAINTRIDSRMDVLSQKLDSKMIDMDTKVSNSLTQGFNKTNEVYTKLVERLAKIDEAQANMTKLSVDVTSLKNVLENNQNRGRFGEFTLERILFSVFGDAKEGVYAFQYSIKGEESSEKPDAVVFLPEPYHMICIDSKFPFSDYKKMLDSNQDKDTLKKDFRNAVKKHIDDVSRKYIIDGKTSPEAILFVPSDAIFGFINGELYELVEYAYKKKVVLTSPSTLQPILANINVIKIEYARSKNLEIISSQIKLLANEFRKFGQDWQRFSKNINSLQNATIEFDKRVRIMNNKFDRIDGDSNLTLNEDVIDLED